MSRKGGKKFTTNHTLNMMGAISQRLTFVINTSPNDRQSIDTTIGDVWRTPREIVIFYRMVESHHTSRMYDAHPLSQHVCYHGLLHPQSNLHCFAIARGILQQTFEQTLSDDMRSAVLWALATQPNSNCRDAVICRLREWNNGHHQFESADIGQAAALIEDYWAWRMDDGPRGMWKMYTMSALFLQSILRSTRPQISSQIQRVTVDDALFGTDHTTMGMVRTPDRYKILAMELWCNLFNRKDVRPQVHSTYTEQTDMRAAIMGYSRKVALPFGQKVKRSKLRCPVNFGCGEPLYRCIQDFVVWFKSQYQYHDPDDNIDDGIQYTQRKITRDPRLYSVFTKKDFYDVWINWLTRIADDGYIDTDVMNLIQSKKRIKTMKWVINRIIISMVAPKLITYSRVVEQDGDVRVHRERLTYIALKRVRPVAADGNFMTDEQIALEFPETAEQRVKKEGHPLLDIGKEAEAIHITQLESKKKKRKVINKKEMQ